jgi:type I restriction enzyme M protein
MDGLEAKLWAAADALRNNMDAAEYKHVVLGLIFLKYISDAFESKHAELAALSAEGADPEDPDEYRAENIFWVPKEARWSVLQDNAPQPAIGKFVDEAMSAIERDNPTLQGVLPKDYGRPGLDKQRIGQLINLVSNIALGSPADRAKDMLGRVYEYFLSQFASAEGKKGGQFYTPAHVVRVLVEMLAPYKGRVYDPCCGSGGMFVQSEKFIEAHQGRIGDLSIYGQESNYTTWRLAKMNLAIRGIDAQIAHGDTFHNDRQPDLKADYVIANPPFNDSDWRGDLLKSDKRWTYGPPPASNA